MGAALELVGIGKSFAGVRALANVGFSVHAGEVHALMGENGAGKSTLIKVMSGVHRPDTGELRLNGVRQDFATPGDASNSGIATVHQELLLFPDLSVAENIHLGKAPRNAFGGVDWPAMRANARRLLDELQSPELDVDAKVRDLSVANRQRVEIARALSQDPKVLIMDEPTAALADVDVKRLIDVIRQLRDRGVAIVYVSHRMQEVFALADRITILRDGEWVATRPAKEVQPSELVSLMVGRSIEKMFPAVTDRHSKLMLEVENLECGNLVKKVSLKVHAGEIVGIAGLIGSGRTELALTLFGIHPASAGSIRIDGQLRSIRSPERAKELGIAYVPEDRGHQGLIRTQTVVENFSLASLMQFARWGFLNRAAERRAAVAAIQEFDVRTKGVGQIVRTLSGGNQQKIVLAKWLATKPRIIILDEPTRGIDVGAKAEIYTLIAKLAREGLAVIVISSDLPEVLGISHRVLVMNAGRITAEFGREEATADRVGQAMIHFEAGAAA